MQINDLLQELVKRNGSDLFLTTGAPPSVRIEGVITPISEESLGKDHVEEMALALLDEEKRAEFLKKHEMNLALSVSGLGRFRVNIFRQRNQVGMVIRSIKFDIPSLESLGIPDILKEQVMKKRGLILFVGATGAGKSTSLAALIGYRNENNADHIITIEDPIEFLHSHKKSIVEQREVGIDTLSYEEALKNTLRQAPDVILIGEVRSRETMEHAIAFSETGHLCFSTLHANNANQALERVINFFAKDRHSQILLDLSLNLRAIVCQRLVRTVDEKRTAVFEILLNTPIVADLIKQGKVDELKPIMEKSGHLGMQTFDEELYKLYKAGRIEFDEALRHADSQNNLRLKASLAKENVKPKDGGGLSIVRDDD